MLHHRYKCIKGIKFIFFIAFVVLGCVFSFGSNTLVHAATVEAPNAFELLPPSAEQLNIYLGDITDQSAFVNLKVGVKYIGHTDGFERSIESWECTNCNLTIYKQKFSVVFNEPLPTVEGDLILNPKMLFDAIVENRKQNGVTYTEGEKIVATHTFKVLSTEPTIKIGNAELPVPTSGDKLYANFNIDVHLYPGKKSGSAPIVSDPNDTRPDACVCTFSYADDSSACTTASNRKEKKEAYLLGKLLSDKIYENDETFLYDEYEDEISGYTAPIPTAANCASYVATVKAGGEAKGTPGDAICTESPISCKVEKCNLDKFGKPFISSCGTKAAGTVGESNQTLDIDAKPKETQLFFDKSDYKAPAEYAGPLPRCAFDGSCRDVNKLLELVIRSAQFVFGFIGSVALVMFVYGGFLMITAFGSAEKFKKGTGVLVAAVVGLFIAFGAYLLIDFVLDALNVSSVFRAIGS